MRNSKEVIAYINELRKQQKMSISELSEKVGMAKSGVSLYFNGKREFPINHAEKFAKALHTNVFDLLGVGDDSMIKVPVLGEVACGQPILAEQNIEGYRYINCRDQSSNLFFLKAKGDSMVPTIPENSYVLIDRDESVEDNDIVAVLIDNSATLKRYHKNGNTVTLTGDNPNFPPIVLTSTEDAIAQILGKAIQVSFDLN